MISKTIDRSPALGVFFVSGVSAIAAARLLSFFAGYLSLSQEILWIRMASFIGQGVPQAFGVTLGLYLLGIAIGAGLGKRYCSNGRNLFRVAGTLLIVAGVLDATSPWLTVAALSFGRVAGCAMLALCIVMTSLVKSMVFPIAHHLGADSNENVVGSSVSKVYFANIVGSTLGPLVTGFVLLQVFSLQQCFMLMAGLTLAVGAYCRFMGGAPCARLAAAGALAALIALPALPAALVPAVIRSTGDDRHGTFKAVFENRYGLIHLNAASDGGDFVFGNNAKDGRINVSFRTNSNGIDRLIVLAAMQPHPRRVLVIGMSGGAWTRMLSSFPGVEHIDVIEINPGYRDVVEQYDEVRPILHDSRVSVHFDDGRRWLKRHPEAHYDLIVMNTTYHWRAYSTLLLSRDFLSVLRDHMHPGALLAYNSTSSWDVYRTAAAVFPHVYRYGNFVVAGNDIVLPPMDEGVKSIAALQLDGQPVVDVTDPGQLDQLRHDLRQLEPYAAVEKNAGRPLEIITDQNMLTEYRYGQSILRYARKQPRPALSILPPQ